MSEDVLVVYAHPYEESFNHAVLEAVLQGITRKGDSYEVCDLYQDGFDPALRAEELEVYGTGGYTDELVGSYIEQTKRADRLVLVAPIWWNDVPAILKGWFDKVMLLGFSWELNKPLLTGKLTYIRRVDVYTTSSNSTRNTRTLLGDAFRKTLIDGTCWQLGIDEGDWHNIGDLEDTTLEQRQAWLKQVEEDQLTF